MTFEIEFTPIQKRLLALALAAIPLGVAFGLLIQAAVGWFAHHARMTMIERERVTYEQLIADAPRRKVEIAGIEASGAMQDFFQASSVADIARNIQSTVTQAVKSTGAILGQATVNAQSDSGSPVIRISLHLAFTGNVAELTRVLYQIAQARPLLFVEQLSVEAGDENPAQGPHRLSVEMTVAGYVRPT